MSCLVDFADTNAHLALVGGQRMFFVAQAREFCQPVKHLQGMRALHTIPRKTGDRPGVSRPCNPALSVELEHGDAGGKPLTFAAQISPSDGAVEIQNRRFTVGSNAEDNHALGHAGEQ